MGDMKDNTASINDETQKPVRTGRKKNDSKIPLTAMIPCKNISTGRLAYGSYRGAGYNAIWSEPGTVQYLEFQELITMRNTAPKFFDKNWIIPVDDEFTAEDVLRQLNVIAKYRNIADTEDLEAFFALPVNEMADRVARLSDGQKSVVYFKAAELYKSEQLNDLRVIRMLERMLGKPITGA